MIVLEDIVKYELTEKKIIGKTTLYRIRALKDFSNIKAGDLGGWIESERNLSQNDNAWVFDNAQVFGNARVFGDARVSGNSRVSGDAQVFDNAKVYDNARVCDNAWVLGNARVYDNARVFDNARVYNDTWISGDVWVCGDAWVFGNAWVSGNARIYNNARVQQTSDYFTIGPIGSRESFTTFYRTKNGISVLCGCFCGTLDEFAARVDETHGDNIHGKAYKAAIKLVKQVMGEKNGCYSNSYNQ
jgi:carbonic anhydrase/acetyltransferase-like protein (isoleucine patch superfamily)